MSERWNAFDKERNLLDGVVLDRAGFPQADYYHLAVNVWVRHTDGDWLFMQRAASKSHFPLYYEAGAGGSVLLDETSLAAAHRELQEETGLTAQSMTFQFSFTEDEHQTHFDTYLAVVGGDKDTVSYQAGETEQHVWVAPAMLADFLAQNQVFTNQKQQLLDFIAENE